MRQRESQSNASRRRRIDRLKAGLVIMILLLGAAAVSTPFLLRGLNEVVSRTFRHEITWAGQHGRNELNMAFRRIAEVDLGLAGLPEARMAVDIFFSRMQMWKEGQFGEFLRESERRIEQHAMIEGLLLKLDDELVALEHPEGRKRSLALLSEIAPIVADISSEAFLRYSRNVVDNSAELAFYHRSQTAMVAGLLLCSLLLIYVLHRQNMSLRVSHRREKDAARQNAFLASHDLLTALPNRKTFMERLAVALRTASRGRAVAVIAIDIDGFKPVNDVLGHKAGDRLLVELAARLHAMAEQAEGGLAARFGGDEFMLLLEGVGDPAAAEGFAETIREEMRRSVDLGGHRVAVDATIGFALADAADLPVEELVHRADVALTVGKSAGKGLVRSFHPAMLEGAAERHRIERELAEADIEQEFVPHYQPVVDIGTGRIIGVECLTRWRHPRRGLVAPGDFIPAAESSGRIVDIGAAILRKACFDAMRWPTPVTVAVNLSAVQLLRTDVASLVRSVLAETGLAACRLKLEITESVLIHDARGTRRLMTELRELGVTVSLDDFGTGFSSLSYLRSFHFDELKIDRSFVADIVHDRQAGAVVQTILALARALDMRVVAEGIETEEQAALLMAMGCAIGQGWRFGRPAPREEIGMLLAQQLGDGRETVDLASVRERRRSA